MSAGTTHFSPPDLVRPKRALISVSDKTGVVDFARALHSLGVEIISTGGTAKSLVDAGIDVTLVDAVTGFPEVMDGRVKTLHPMVHGGILAVRDNPDHVASMSKLGITPIDLVCVNLYPFERTVARRGITESDAIEQIDVGGPAMIRAGAKNFAYVSVLTSPTQYARVQKIMSANEGATTLAARRSLAVEAFAATSMYDAAIASHFSKLAQSDEEDPSTFPSLLVLAYKRRRSLRYGENPHQSAAVYEPFQPESGTSVLDARQLHGKHLSFNNVLDAAAALELAQSLAALSFVRERGLAAACVVKHTNPCGASIAPTIATAVDLAIAGDPLAAYGGIMAVSGEVDTATAARLCRDDVFLEVLAAPSFSEGAAQQLRGRWANIRLLEIPSFAERTDGAPPRQYKHVPGGLLAQDRDLRLAQPNELSHRAGPAPTVTTREIVSFLEIICRGLSSNAIAIGGTPVDDQNAMMLFGAGSGVVDRLTASRTALAKAGVRARGSIAFSDAFFPFDDGPRVLTDAGVTTLVHPGGSKRDSDTFALCDVRGVTCLTTGVRHFRH